MISWLLKLSVEDKLYVGLLVVVSLVLVSRYHTTSYSLKPLLWLCLLHLGTELLADYLHFGFTPGLENVYLYHLLTPLDYSILAMFFGRLFVEPSLQNAVRWSVPVFWALAILFTVVNNPLEEINTLAFMTECLFVISGCFVFFRRLLTRVDGYVPEKDPVFWIVVAILFYFVGNLFVYGSLNYLTKHNITLAIQVYQTSYVFYYLLYGTIGVTCLRSFPVRIHEQ